ncbi:adhesin [Cellulomonas fimi]|nr:adhesin [Cellulomonas fimi]
MTENARTAVRTLTERAGLPDETGGLRIAEQEAGGFELALVAAPVPGDDVVAESGARVYVDPLTSQTLSDQRLDVEPTGAGSSFTLTPQ